MLRIMRVDLKNLQHRVSWRHCPYNDSKQRSGSIHSGGVRLAGRRNNHFAALFVNSLDDGNFLNRDRSR
jgi:hypothetical protein